jgi:hypothetical protein
MSTNTITALKGLFTHQEVYPENLSDRQIAALQAIKDFLDGLDAENPPEPALPGGLSERAQSLIDEAAAAGLHAYAHHTHDDASRRAYSQINTGSLGGAGVLDGPEERQNPLLLLVHWVWSRGKTPPAPYDPQP